ncbi:hypothetical protein PVAP13_6KG071305 [Panicum virgatum]|uniref:Uncharacterized protein n=1 Tax=Panicum virgatum TaxID=38727 RepID=A0A8T0R9U9_PANVG|nr:hypothetical protein PVAP13_6KG071305 [Panicum virgatum]
MDKYLVHNPSIRFRSCWDCRGPMWRRRYIVPNQGSCSGRPSSSPSSVHGRQHHDDLKCGPLARCTIDKCRTMQAASPPGLATLLYAGSRLPARHWTPAAACRMLLGD